MWPDARLAESMDPWLLGDGFADRVEVEIDWFEGCKPAPLAIEGLRKTLVKYGPPDRPVDIQLDDEIPLSEWGPAEQRQTEGEGSIVARHADFSAAPVDPEFRVERRYALFVPGLPNGLFGYSGTWPVEHGDGVATVRGVVVFRKAHEKHAFLWLSADEIERMTLIHEFGHQLGLVGNRTHERDGPHRQHCTSLKCLMAHPTPRVVARNVFAGLFDNFPDDYCSRCQEDIRRAQATWRAGMAADPDYRNGFVRERQAGLVADRVRYLQRAGRTDEATDALDAALHAYPDDEGLKYLQVTNLIDAGRLEDAASVLQGLDRRQRPNAFWALGHALVEAGRYDEAIELMDREGLHKAEDYDFEQSSFVLLSAYRGAGLPADAIALIDELLDRGHSISFQRESMLVHRATLLKDAGRVDEAFEATQRGLRDRDSRPLWLELGADLLEERGDLQGAQALRRECVQTARRALEQAGSSEARTYATWDLALIYARMGEFDQAAEMLRSDPATLRQPYSVCKAAAFTPIRGEPSYADLFAGCPAPLVKTP